MSSTTTVTGAAPHHLIADAPLSSHRRTRAGDARCGRPTAAHRRTGPAAGRRPVPRIRSRPRQDVRDEPDRRDEFEAYRADLEAAERRVAGEIDPGARALVVAILVFVLLVSFILPHTGGARGIDVLMGDDTAISVGIALPSRLFSWFALVFGVGFSMLALLTRRWTLAWIALAGSALGSALGMLAVWSRQTAAAEHPGPGIGLIVGWLAVLLLTFHWAQGGVDAHRGATGRRSATSRTGRRNQATSLLDGHDQSRRRRAAPQTRQVLPTLPPFRDGLAAATAVSRRPSPPRSPTRATARRWPGPVRHPRRGRPRPPSPPAARIVRHGSGTARRGPVPPGRSAGRRRRRGPSSRPPAVGAPIRLTDPGARCRSRPISR